MVKLNHFFRFTKVYFINYWYAITNVSYMVNLLTDSSIGFHLRYNDLDQYNKIREKILAKHD